MNATTLIPIAQIGFGFFLLFIVGKLYLSARDRHSWEIAQGIITKSAIKEAGAAFSPDIEYQYSILGVEYKGTSVTMPLKQTYNAKVVQSWVSEYPVGKKVNVYYNPEIHHMAVLEKGFSIAGSWVLIGSSLFLILSGFVFLLLLVR